MRRRMFTLALSAALATWARAATAQTVQLRAGGWWLSSRDVAPGAGLAALVPLGARWRLDGAWQHGLRYQDFRCFEWMDSCFPEVSRVTSTLYRLAIDYRYPLLRGARWNAGASGGFGVARLYTIREWPGSPGGDDSKNTYVLLQAGMELERQLLASSPLRFVVGGRAALAVDPEPETITTVSSGGSPSFWRHFVLAGAEVGFAWPLGGQAPR